MLFEKYFKKAVLNVELKFGKKVTLIYRKLYQIEPLLTPPRSRGLEPWFGNFESVHGSFVVSFMHSRTLKESERRAPAFFVVLPQKSSYKYSDLLQKGMGPDSVRAGRRLSCS